MKRKDSGKRTHAADYSMWLNVAAAVVFTVLLVWGMYLVREKLLTNTNLMANSLAKSYADEEESKFKQYESILSLAASNIKEMSDSERSPDDIRNMLISVCGETESSVGGSVIDPYAVLDGEIIAAYPWEGDSSYDFASMDWYTEAISNPGETVYTDVYKDAVTGKRVITISRSISEGDVLAFDILLENFGSIDSVKTLPYNSSYILFDSACNIVYSSSRLSVDELESSDYVRELRSRIESGSLEGHTASISDTEGRNRGVYYYTMPNDWISVITIPVKDILYDDWNEIFLVFAFIYAMILMAIVMFTVMNFKSKARSRYVEDTLRILGDTYYAIYRIDLKDGTYEAIKQRPDVSAMLGTSGTYEKFISVMETCVDKSTFNSFRDNFSIENMQSLAGDNVREFGGDYLRKFEDGDRWVNVRIIYNVALKINEVIMCFKDVDFERRRSIEQYELLENALSTANSTVEKRNALFSNISHDMRTPLNAIVGLSQLSLRDDPDREALMENMKTIEKSGRQLLGLVNDILDMSKIEGSSESILNPEPVNLRETIEGCIEMFRPLAAGDNKKLTFTFEAVHERVICDPLRISQILNNLISNALKYSGENCSAEVAVEEITSGENSGQFRFTVTDDGMGMSSEFIEHIFEPFARETAFAPSRISGTGLGMPIVKSLVQQMNGSINVQSELGRGSRVSFTLPLQLAAPGEEDASSARSGGVSCDGACTQSGDGLSGLKILIAEDNAINMKILSMNLHALNMDVLCASDGKQALDMFLSSEENSIDAILMDMQMPVMDGCSAAEAIRHSGRGDSLTVPIIAVTANTFSEDIEKATRFGMNAHIAKPIEPGRLISVLSRLCTKKTT